MNRTITRLEIDTDNIVKTIQINYKSRVKDIILCRCGAEMTKSQLYRHIFSKNHLTGANDNYINSQKKITNYFTIKK